MTAELESSGVAKCSQNATAVGQGTIMHLQFFILFLVRPCYSLFVDSSMYKILMHAYVLFTKFLLIPIICLYTLNVPVFSCDWPSRNITFFVYGIQDRRM